MDQQKNQPIPTRRTRLATAMDSLFGALRKFALAGSGFDREILREHGSDLCKSNALTVGAVNMTASAIGAVFAAVKTFMMTPGTLALPASVFAFLAYFTIIWNLERQLAKGINAFWTTREKVKAFAGRATVTVFFTGILQAAPLILLSLGSQLESRLAEFELEARQTAKTKLESLHDVSGAEAKSVALTKAVRDAMEMGRVLPEAVVDVIQMAAQCDKDAEALFTTNKRKANGLQAQIPALIETELSATATAIQKQAAKKTRDDINVRVEKLADAVAVKKAECRNTNQQATEAKTRYLKDVAAKQETAEVELKTQKQAVVEVYAAVARDVAHANTIAKRGNASDSAAEMKAAVALLKEQPSAQIMALFIFFFFCAVDIAAAGLKLLSKPGPYDYALRKRDAIAADDTEKTVREIVHARDAREVKNAAKAKGIATFHAKDGGAVFARLESIRLDQDIRVAEEGVDIAITSAQLKDLNTITTQVVELHHKVEHNPSLAARLDAVLAMLQREPTAART